MSRRAALVALVVVVAVGRADTSPPTGVIALRETKVKEAPHIVEVASLPAAALKDLAGVKWDAERWQKLLAVYVHSGDPKKDQDRPALLGTWRVEGKTVTFRPRFPFSAGVQYRAVYNPAGLPTPARDQAAVEKLFRLPRPQTPPTTVSQVYPTGNKLPENQLKFYIHFSAPMTQGNAYKHVRLLDEKGKEVKWPFLELEEELWNNDGTRFTLYFDPGRIKRGLKPREEVGPVLVEGKKYTLVISSKW